MNGHMGFGEDHGAGHAGRLTIVMGELVEIGAERRQSGIVAELNALTLQGVAVKQKLRIATALVEVGDEMKTLYGIPIHKGLIKQEILTLRPRSGQIFVPRGT